MYISLVFLIESGERRSGVLSTLQLYPIKAGQYQDRIAKIISDNIKMISERKIA